MTLFSRTTRTHRIIGLAVGLGCTAFLTKATAAPRVPQGGAPPVVQQAVGFYDAERRRVMLVGGADSLRSTDRHRTWSWTGARWELETAQGPSSRSNAAAAFDPARHVAIISGGMRKTQNDSAYEVINDSWERADAGWRPFVRREAEPRDHHAMVYDERRRAILMFGGMLANRSAPWPTETWALQPSGWERLPLEGPSARARTAMVYDSWRQQVVLFGGVGASPARGAPQPFHGDTWLLDNVGWRRAADQGPRGRYAHGMVFDERLGVVLMYGGAAAHRDAPLSDMWQWDGTRWTEVALDGATPGHRYQPIMIYDRARARTVLFGGLQDSRGDTWEWDGRSWSEIRP